MVDQAGNLLPIYDPQTTRRNPAFKSSEPVSIDNLEYLRDPFPGNVIPQDRLDPTAQQALALYPANSLFIDGYLTTPGLAAEPTQRMITSLGFTVETDVDVAVDMDRNSARGGNAIPPAP